MYSYVAEVVSVYRADGSRGSVCNVRTSSWMDGLGYRLWGRMLLIILSPDGSYRSLRILGAAELTVNPRHGTCDVSLRTVQAVVRCVGDVGGM